MITTTSNNGEPVTAVVSELLTRMTALEGKFAEHAQSCEIQHAARLFHDMLGPVTALHLMLATRDAELLAIKDTADREAFQRGYEARRAEERPALHAV